MIEPPFTEAELAEFRRCEVELNGMHLTPEEAIRQLWLEYGGGQFYDEGQFPEVRNMLFLAEPVFFDFDNKRAAQKAKYGGEFFPSTHDADGCGTTFFDFFQQDKNTGLPKGIVVITP